MTIPTELSDFVQDAVARGTFRNEDEVVAEALRLLQRREELRQDVNAGIEQLQRGECLTVDDEGLLAFAEDVKVRGRQRLEADNRSP